MRFRSKACGGFSILGPVGVQADLNSDDLKLVGECFVQGIAQHPKGELWNSWLSPKLSV